MADELDRSRGVARFIRETRKHIADYGLSVLHVHEEPGSPGFAYSIGLWETFGHPEILIIGLRREQGHGIINACADLIRAGTVFREGERYSDVLKGYAVEFLEIAPDYHPTYLGSAIRFYGKRVPALQIVYPDRDGRFPWDEGTDGMFHEAQPLLSAR